MMWIELHFLSPPLLTIRPGVGELQSHLVFNSGLIEGLGEKAVRALIDNTRYQYAAAP